MPIGNFCLNRVDADGDDLHRIAELSSFGITG